jgi:zinc transporter ZupT
MQQAATWAREASQSIRNKTTLPTNEDYQQALKEHSGAPLAIWLGILLDGIPESFVIGTVFLSSMAVALQQANDAVTFVQVVPFTLIAGLFLSNFPEAMSSSAGMQRQGWRGRRILLMWVSLMVMTAIGAGVGYLVGGAMAHTVLVAVEGVAAGAMLTMIASTMLPEAVHLGGSNTVGISTLLGFLAAICFKLFE